MEATLKGVREVLGTPQLPLPGQLLGEIHVGSKKTEFYGVDVVKLAIIQPIVMIVGISKNLLGF